eukprot:5218037-Pleurochrysis_carterae.AAC.1
MEPGIHEGRNRSDRHDVGAAKEKKREGQPTQVQSQSRRVRQSTEAQDDLGRRRTHPRDLRPSRQIRQIQTSVR